MIRRCNFGRRGGDLCVKILSHSLDDRLFGGIGEKEIRIRKEIPLIWCCLRNECVFFEPLQELAIYVCHLLYRCSLRNAESERLKAKGSLRDTACDRKNGDRLFEKVVARMKHAILPQYFDDNAER